MYANYCAHAFLNVLSDVLCCIHMGQNQINGNNNGRNNEKSQNHI